MNFKKQIGFRLLAACLSTLIFLPQASALAMQTISESGDISKSEKSKVKSQEANDVNMASEYEVEPPKKIRKKGKGKSSGNIAPTTFLGTLNFAQMLMLIKILSSSKENEKRLSRVEDRLEDILAKKSEEDSSIKRSSIIKRDKDLENSNGVKDEDEDEDEKEKEKEKAEEISKWTKFWLDNKKQVQEKDNDLTFSQKLEEITFGAGKKKLTGEQIDNLLAMRLLMKKFLNSSELVDRKFFHFYISSKTLANDINEFGLYQIVYVLYSDEALYIPLYGMLLLLTDIGAREEEVMESDRQLYNDLKTAIGSTMRECLNEILSFLRNDHEKVKDNEYLSPVTLEQLSFIAENVKKGYDKLGGFYLI